MAKKIIPELDTSRDLAVLKSNTTFSGSFTTSLSGSSWTPPNAVMWFDASDESTITEATGVSQWSDKSGNNNHATQTNGSLQPKTGTRTLNGMNVIELEPTLYFNIPTIDMIGHECWAVVRTDDLTQDFTVLGGNNTQMTILTSGQVRLWSSNTPYNPNDTKADQTLVQDEDYLLGFLAHNPTKKFSVDGVLTDNAGEYVDGRTQTHIYIGRNQYANAQDGIIAELIILPQGDTHSRNSIEGYLAHKWGLASKLPSDHPYKNSMPLNDVTVSFGDISKESHNTPIHTYTSIPPYAINIKDIDKSTIETISISGNSLTAVDVSRFENVTNVNVADNLLPRSEISKILVDLDKNGQEDGTLTASGNISGGDYTSDSVNSFHRILSKGWNVTGTLWTPKDITTSLWLDASDASTITIDTGVSQWDDKSGNLNHAVQGVGSNQPTTGTRTINGKNVIDFNGSQSVTNVDAPLSNATSIFAVGFTDSVGGAYQRLLTSDNNLATFFGKGNSNSDFAVFYGDNFTWDAPVADTNTPTREILDPTIMGAVADGVGNSIPYWNGEAQNSKVCSQINDTGISVGGAFSQGWDGVIAEVIMVNATVTDEVRQIIEGYLAHKWGLTANLPIAHPYKTIAP